MLKFKNHQINLKFIALAATVSLFTLSTPDALCQSLVLESYKQTAQQFIKDGDFEKAEKILNVALSDAEKNIAQSKDLRSILEMLAKIYTETGNKKKLVETNNRLQNIASTPSPAASSKAEKSIDKKTVEPVNASSQDSEEPKVAVYDEKPQSEAPAPETASNTTEDKSVVKGSDEPAAVNPADVEFTEPVKEHLQPLKTDVIASTQGIAGELKNNTLLKKAVELKQLKGHISWIKCVLFSPEGTQAASGGVDRTARIWDLESGKELYRLEGHEDNVNCIAYSPDGKRLVTGSNDNNIVLWDIESGRKLKVFEGHKNIVTSLAFSNSGRLIASGSYDGTVRIWDLGSGKTMKVLGDEKLDAVRAVTFLPGESKVVSGGSDRLISFFDINSGKVLKQLKGHKGDITWISASQDGSKILSSSRDLTVRLWSTTTGAEEKQLVGHGNWVIKAHFVAGDTKAISCSLDKTFRLWDLDTGNELSASTIGPFGMWGAAMSQDGTRGLTGSNNYAIRLWQIVE